MIEHFMPLLGPNLVEISSGCSNEFITAAFLSMAEQRCRGLRKLEVSGARISYANSSVLQDVVERVSTSFPVLQTLFCLEYQPSAPSLLKLSCSRTLRTLDISLVNPESMVDLISASSEVHLFPVLRCLGLYFITELPILLLQASRFARLKVLFIHGYVKASASEIQQFLAAISGFKSLRSLHMEIVQEIPIESPSIAPLLTLHNLRTLTIWYLPLSLPDDYTEKMISAWPSIRHLEISIPGFVATLLALRAFGRR
ncbi:hypothetical protein K474DRAFT_642176 [Panus rudis PR-1116 ss-1]|nr:hypothetical protein K474DRAFT_642176 [Panus rudis PR-1116 ss-1]